LKRLAFGAALAALLLNLATEHWLMAMPSGVVLVPGLADFYQAWNRGVSFSLLTQDNETGRYLLIAVLAAISLGVSVMAWRARHWMPALAYGLILGGALGNLIDRAIYGAVFDFLSLHLGTLPLFVCNLSDIFISAGACLLLLELAMSRQDGART
jgi:signal peptidase II